MADLWDLVQSYMDQHGSSQAWVARRIGTSPQTITNWKQHVVLELPNRDVLLALAELVGMSYEDVVQAGLNQAGYTGYADAARKRAEP